MPSAVMGGASRFCILLTTPFPPVIHRSSSLIFVRPLTRRVSTSTRHLNFSTPSTHFHHLLLPPAIKSSLVHRKLHAHPLNSHSEHSDSPCQPSHQPWPEWSHLINSLLSSQWNLSPEAEDHGILPGDAFAVYEGRELSEEFIRAASVCLAFSRAHPDLLGLLSRSDVEVMVSHGTPFLFNSAVDTARRMRAYLGIGGGNVLESDNANTVDIMKYILSYASNHYMSPEYNNPYSSKLVESSACNLSHQMIDVTFGDPALKVPALEQYQFYARNEQNPRPLRQNVEMKRGDWICPKCSFMNFARNFECLECQELRPKRQLTGMEWQCQKCNFFNYGRNLVCLRCDRKRPGEAAANIAQSMLGLGDMDIRIPGNEQKAMCRFNKVPEPVNAYNLNSADVDEVIPEIMPLREGENRFVVSTRKTPLERRRANFQNEKHMGGNGISEGDTAQSPGTNKARDSSVRRSLEQILGHSFPVSAIHDHSNASEANIEINLSTSFPQSSISEFKDNLDLNGKPERQTGSQNKDKEQAKKSEKWFQRVGELHNVKDLPSAIEDEDFPEIMPTRKGENRFVVSKKKDRSLSSPAYNRQATTEHTSNPKFVPFVPFPPGYFARKDTPVPENLDSSSKALTETLNSLMAENFAEKLDDARHRIPENDIIQETENQVRSTKDWSSKLSGNHWATLGGNSSQSSCDSQAIRSDTWSMGSSIEQNVRTQLPSQNARTGWAGKSLEGSAVKEPDTLDMSEEAKTERWFRRVAQVKDISELSQIPDEDFPSIMPQRKGVNRFVVSKRKTPLERRLASPKCKRNLPIVSSNPLNKDNDNK